MDSNADTLQNGDNKPLNPTYKAIPEADLEEQAALLSKLNPRPPVKVIEPDGADEKMLPDEEKKIADNSKINIADVKFISNEKQNGDAKVDIGEIRNAFVGMGKEELMKYANDPFWVRLRWILFIGFWLLWAGMLIGAILIIVAAPKCAAPAPRTWWEEGPLTAIDVETNQEQLNAIKQNGIKGVIVHYPLDTYENLSTSKEFNELLKKANDSNVNVIVDLLPAFTNRWFALSEANNLTYVDYYIWASAKGSNASGSPIPPNNWLSKRNESAWLYSDVRKQFYLAPNGLPQLNFRNNKVVDEFTNILLTFLNAGVKGVRLHDVPYLLVHSGLKNEAPASTPGFTHTDYGFYLHTRTEYLSELGPLIKQWRDLVKEKTENGPFMLADDLRKLDPFKVNGTLLVDLPIRSRLFSVNKQTTAVQLSADLEEAFTVVGKTMWPLWQHNGSVLEEDVFDIVTMLLPGTVLVDNNHTVDAKLLKLRDAPSFTYGSTAHYVLANQTVFAYVRVKTGSPGYVIALNPTANRETVDFTSEIPEMTEEVTIQLFSKNYNETGIDVKLKVDAHQIPLSPGSAIVFSYVPKSAD